VAKNNKKSGKMKGYEGGKIKIKVEIEVESRKKEEQ
jgi:hypothetical protein